MGALAGAACFLVWVFFGHGSDLRRLHLRVLMDGGAPGHTFFHGNDLSGISLRELNLRKATFPCLNLERTDFQEAKLKGAVFTTCNARKANFRNAELVGATFDGCNLNESDLRGADVRGANLAGSALRFALLSGAMLGGANLEGVDLTGVAGLSIAQLRLCKNWHLARYDEDTALSIKAAFQPAVFKALGFASWEQWRREQKRPGLSQRALPPSPEDAR